MGKKALIAFNEDELNEFFTKELQQPSFRAKQVFSWVIKGSTFSEMVNLPKDLREKLEDECTCLSLNVVQSVHEEKSDTTKVLFSTADGLLIECVVLVYEKTSTVCVSTQAGCRMGCRFCVSGKDGLFRNLHSDEMLSQVIAARKLTGAEISNIVLMGSGEPLDNYDETIDFIQKMLSERYFGFSPRRITLSTCGLTKGIEKLTNEGLNINLSLSLHCAVHEIRQEMMPVEKACPIAESIVAAHNYRSISKRRLTLEYCVVQGLNDTNACVDALKKLINRTDDLVNLIDVNEGSGKYKKNTSAALSTFAEKLKRAGIDYTIRRKLGSDINAACGQLRSGFLKQQFGDK